MKRKITIIFLACGMLASIAVIADDDSDEKAPQENRSMLHGEWCDHQCDRIHSSIRCKRYRGCRWDSAANLCLQHQ